MRTLSLCALAFTLLALAGCPTPPPPPEQPPAPKPVVVPTDPETVVDGDVTVAYENGLRILVKRIPGAELTSMQLYIKGGARLRRKQTAGIELLALQTAVSGGTEALDKQAFGKKLSEMGSDLGASALNSYSIIAAKSLTEELDNTFGLLADSFLNPALPASEIEIQRERQIAAIKQREVTPDGRLSLLVIEAMYSGHPYENLPTGTIESVEPLTRDQLMAHLAGLRQTSRLELVVVGDVAADHVRELVRAKLGGVPRGSYQPEPLPTPSFAKPKLEVIMAELPTNYVEASFIGPKWSEPDFAASVLAMRVLHNRVWEEVRTKRNLSYAPSGQYAWSGEVTRGALYVTAVDPNTTMKVMLDEARSLQTTLVGDKELTGAKSVFLTSHLMANEATNGQASWLAICDLIGGDWRRSRTLPEQIKAVTAEQIQSFAKNRIGKLQTVMLGPAKDVDRLLFESL